MDGAQSGSHRSRYSWRGSACLPQKMILSSMILSKRAEPNPTVIDSRYNWRGSGRLPQKMILSSMILSNPMQ
jgi:hypothetical protein